MSKLKLYSKAQSTTVNGVPFNATPRELTSIEFGKLTLSDLIENQILVSSADSPTPTLINSDSSADLSIVGRNSDLIDYMNEKFAKCSDGIIANNDNRFVLNGSKQWYQVLDNSGYIRPDLISPVSMAEPFVTNNIAGMLAISTAGKGDTCVITETSSTYIKLNNNDPSVLSNWQLLLSPLDGIQTINGKSGATITLDHSDLMNLNLDTNKLHVTSTDISNWNSKEPSIPKQDGFLTRSSNTWTWLSTIPWNSVSSKPTTLSGYGITDAVNFSSLANYYTTTQSDFNYYNKAYIDTNKADKVHAHRFNLRVDPLGDWNSLVEFGNDSNNETLQFRKETYLGANAPTFATNNANGILSLVACETGGVGKYGKQIAFGDSNNIYHRTVRNGAFVSSWVNFWDSNNFDPTTKANLASPTFTGVVSGIDKTMVGLGNVDNVSDASKPVSTAQQTALNLKANLASPTFTGNPLSVTPALGNNDTSIATSAFVQSAIGNTLAISASGTTNLTNTQALATTIVYTGNAGATFVMPTANRGYIIVNKTAFAITVQSNTATATVSIPPQWTLYVFVLDSANVTYEGNLWGGIYGKPTDIAGYGITDAYTKTQMDTSLALKATLASPSFTGTPVVPWQPITNNGTQASNAGHVWDAINSTYSSAVTATLTALECRNNFLTYLNTATADGIFTIGAGGYRIYTVTNKSTFFLTIRSATATKVVIIPPLSTRLVRCDSADTILEVNSDYIKRYTTQGNWDAIGTFANDNQSWDITLRKEDGGVTPNKPSWAVDNANGILSLVSHPTGGVGKYGKQIAFGNTDDLYMRRVENGVLKPWMTIWSSNNFDPSTKSDLSHSHTFSSLTSKPTTLSGYGIEDGVALSYLSGYYTKTGADALFYSKSYIDTNKADKVHAHRYTLRTDPLGDWNSLAEFGNDSNNETLQFRKETNLGTNAPAWALNDANGILSLVASETGGVGKYGKQIAFGNTDDLFMRRVENGVLKPWVKLWSSNNFDPNTKANTILEKKFTYTTAGGSVLNVLATKVGNKVEILLQVSVSSADCSGISSIVFNHGGNSSTDWWCPSTGYIEAQVYGLSVKSSTEFLVNPAYFGINWTLAEVQRPDQIRQMTISFVKDWNLIP
jgi:hypothetical protein